MALFPHESRRILDPGERAAEILFGVIMTMTFTGTLSVVDAGRDDVRAMFIGALGCNVAWGIIDGIIYLMACRAERNGALRMFIDRPALRVGLGMTALGVVLAVLTIALGG